MKIYCKDQQKSINKNHRINPIVGDFWHEMFCPYYVVKDVTETHVSIFDQFHMDYDGKYIINKDNVVTMTREEFINLHIYSGNGKYVGEFYYCDVMPSSS